MMLVSDLNSSLNWIFLITLLSVKIMKDSKENLNQLISKRCRI